MSNFVAEFMIVYETMTLRELFDEENAYTALADQWENYGTLRSTLFACKARTT